MSWRNFDKTGHWFESLAETLLGIMKDLFHDLEYDIFLSQFCTILEEMINSFMEIILNIKAADYLKMIGLVWWCLTPLSTYISVIPWRSVLLMEETGVPGKNHQPVVSHWQTLSHNVVDLALIGWLILVFNATFRNIMATSFSGGRSRSTRRESPTMGKQLVNFITCGCELSAPFFVISRAWTHVVLVIGLYELLGNPTT